MISHVFQGGYLEHILTFAAREASCNLLVWEKLEDRFIPSSLCILGHVST